MSPAKWINSCRHVGSGGHEREQHPGKGLLEWKGELPREIAFQWVDRSLESSRVRPCLT